MKDTPAPITTQERQRHQAAAMDTASGAQQSTRDCVHYLRKGTCRYGPNCRFNHPCQQPSAYPLQISEFPERTGQPDCQFYLKTGTCKFGAQCKYNHPHVTAGSARGPPLLNCLGLPIRPGEKECTFYLRTGSCKFGAACKFHHPDPAGNGIAVSPSFPHNALVPPTPWRHLYVPSSGLSGASPYMPMYSSSPQGVVFNGGWNMYQGLGTLMSNGDHRGFYNGAQLQVTGMRPSYDSSLNCSPRPVYQDCQYYVQTGHCKFGAGCKYLHRKNMVIPLVAASLSPMGLPLRPGQPLCSFYLQNGICKFGPVCRYDHPMRGISESIPSSPSKETVKTEDSTLPPKNIDGNDGLGEKKDPLLQGSCDTPTENVRDSAA